MHWNSKLSLTLTTVITYSSRVDDLHYAIDKLCELGGAKYNTVNVKVEIVCLLYLTNFYCFI